MKAILTLTILFLLSKMAFGKGELNELGAKGRFHVGFKRYYVFDSSRAYRSLYDAKENPDTSLFCRPMVVNIWYPTKEKPKAAFPYGRYITFAAPDSTWRIFLKHLTDYNRNTIKENCFSGLTYGEDTFNANKDFSKLMDVDCALSEGSVCLRKKTPLIIYQQSLGGTIEENATLCQSLAANGFTVVNCAYQSDNSSKIYSDWNLERAESDVYFLLHFVRRVIPVDGKNIHLLGFSFGAQSTLNLLTKAHHFKSAVTLDSRLEYGVNYHPRGFKNLPQTLIENVDSVNVPLLMFATPAAVFAIPDSLLFSERIYAVANGFQHYDFTAQKQLANCLFCRRQRDRNRAQQKVAYNEICARIISFFKAQSGGKKYRNACKSSKWLCMERMEIGRSRPVPNEKEITLPRHAILSIPTLGLNRVKELFRERGLSANEEMLNDYAYGMAAQGKHSIARSVLLWAVTLFPHSSNLFDSLGEIYFLENDFPNALKSYQTAVQLDPENKNALTFIQKLTTILNTNSPAR